MAFVLAMGMSVSAMAATTPDELGEVDFPTRIGGNGTKVSKTVKAKGGKTYKVNGILFSSEGKEVFRIINEERTAKGLKKLAWEPELLQPAVQRALEQYVLQSHTRPNGSDWSTVSSLANGENLAGGDTDASAVMDGWMNSPGHKANILDKDFTSVCVACVETDKMVFWVQLFHSDKKVKASDKDKDVDEDTPEEKPKTTEPKSDGEVTSKSIVADLNKAKTSAAITPVVLKGIDKLPIDALKGAANWGATNKKTVSITVSTLTSTGKSTQGQLTLDPAGFTKNKSALKTGVWVDKDSVSDGLDSFNKAYPNAKAAMIKCGQTGSYGGTVGIGAKAVLTGLDTKKLLFYTYDTKTGKATKLDLGTQGYSIDKNKYLRFDTNKGGYIVVTDKAL